jgi:hypothetical protein
MNDVQAVLVDTINKLKCDKDKKCKNNFLQRIPYRVPPGGKHYCRIRNGKKNVLALMGKIRNIVYKEAL